MGPYPERNRWRVVIVENGRRKSAFLTSNEEALRLKTGAERELSRLSSRKLADVLAEWSEDKLRAGRWKPSTVAHFRERLRGFFGPYMERDIAALTPRRAATLYRAVTERPSPKTERPLSAASHQLSLYVARQFFGWVTGKGYLRCNPFADVQPIGRINAGKPQLRIDGARRFIDIAIRYYEETQHPLAIGMLLALRMGLRTSEVLGCMVRDVDDGGRLLWVDGTKSVHARRHLEVPDVLRPYLVRLAAGKRAEDPLFGCGTTGKPRQRQTVWAMVHRLCERAGVLRVSTHSLRGLHATLGVQSGAVSHAVAAALGHGSFAMTERHYAQPGSVANAATARVASKLEAPRPATTSTLPPSITEQLAQLDPTKLAMALRVAKSLTDGAPPTP